MIKKNERYWIVTDAPGSITDKKGFRWHKLFGIHADYVSDLLGRERPPGTEIEPLQLLRPESAWYEIDFAVDAQGEFKW